MVAGKALSTGLSTSQVLTVGQLNLLLLLLLRVCPENQGNW